MPEIKRFGRFSIVKFSEISPSLFILPSESFYYDPLNTTPPNVIVFFTDQQRWDTTGVHGNPLDLTPNFDRMAREGTHVHYSFTCQPVCGPARSCLQTGLYATETGVFRNGITLAQDAMTLAQYFHAAGYARATSANGTWPPTDPVPAEERGGYDDWLASNLLEFTSDAYRSRSCMTTTSRP